MKLIRTQPNHAERGTAILMAVFVSFAMASTAAVLMSLAQSDKRDTDVRRYNAEARYLALGAIEAAMGDIQDMAQTGAVPPATLLVDVDGTPVDVTVLEVAPSTQEFDEGGLMQFASMYQLTGTATSNGHTAQENRLIEVLSIPVYQFALFWENDLEIWPGPNMTVGGRVHCNADMYAGAGNSLTLDTNYVHVLGDVRTKRKHANEVNKGDVRIRRWVADPFDPSEPAEYVSLDTKVDMDAAGVPSVSGYDSAFAGYDPESDGDYYGPDDWLPFALGALEKWEEPVAYSGGSGNTLLTAEHGIGNADLTDVASLAMFEPVEIGEQGDYQWNAATEEFEQVPAGTGTHVRGPFHAAADLVVLTKSDGSWVAYDGDGKDVSATVTAALGTESFYDARQAEGNPEPIDVTVIDMGKLEATGLFPANGLLYTGTYGAGEGTDAGGVRLTNGSELAGPLSVVSANSIYVHGDYNTVDKKPAAVLGDAIHLLSNAWDGTKKPGTLPRATDTTFQMAIVGGNTPSSTGVYSGGVENFPRLHEAWTGQKLTITGSMVCPWESVYATSPWFYGGDNYSAPNRDWYYDSDFTDPDNLPPFALVSATVRNAVSW